MSSQVQGLLIAGQWRPSCSGESFDVLAPEDGRTLACVASGGVEDIELAVADVISPYNAPLSLLRRGEMASLPSGEKTLCV